MIHPFHRKSFYLVGPHRSERPSTRLDIGRPDTFIAFELCTHTSAKGGLGGDITAKSTCGLRSMQRNHEKEGGSKFLCGLGGVSS